ncbi:MAG: hypothetical protein D6744_07830 [Planctomycetota bacterium]|nr:MAG: hypothetical protein D6744_07830 [Planctomycetota bacterium]
MSRARLFRLLKVLVPIADHAASAVMSGAHTQDGSNRDRFEPSCVLAAGATQARCEASRLRPA